MAKPYNSVAYDDEEHTTYKGKVVYKRKKHSWTVKDLERMIQKIPLRYVDKEKIIDAMLRDEIIDDIQEDLLQLFLGILGTVMPNWFVELVEWLYRNVDAGIPPWIPPELQ